jgi:hypothetical protein
MAGVYTLIIVALVAMAAGGFALANGSFIGIAFIAFGLMLLALGLKQRSTINRKGVDDA